MPQLREKRKHDVLQSIHLPLQLVHTGNKLLVRFKRNLLARQLTTWFQRWIALVKQVQLFKNLL